MTLHSASTASFCANWHIIPNSTFGSSWIKTIKTSHRVSVGYAHCSHLVLERLRASSRTPAPS